MTKAQTQFYLTNSIMNYLTLILIVFTSNGLQAA